MPEVHASAIVHAGAQLGDGVRIGPFSVIGPEVVLHRRVEIKSHCVITGVTEIGPETVVFPFSVLGEIPQDLKYAGEKTRLVIGARNRIREHVTMNTGTAKGGGITRIGDDGLFMAGCHIAHDATLGDRVIIVNSSAIAGHCVIDDDVIVGGLSGVHQWVRIGRGAIIGACTMVGHDVLPYALVHGARGAVEGVNLVGLKRRGVARAEIAAVRAAFDALGAGEGEFSARIDGISRSGSALVREIVDFVRAPSHRQFLTP